jgi:hypothetical protein
MIARDDIIGMAREANLWQSWLERLEESRKTIASLEKFAALVAAHERERIIAANAPEIEKVNEYIKALEDSIATVIRARGEK